MPNTVSFKVRVAKNIISQAARELEARGIAGSQDVADQIQKRAREILEPHRITGETAAGIIVERLTRLTWGVTSTAGHSAALEYGHMQEPGRYVPALGARLVADYVAAVPYMTPAAMEAVETASAIYARVFLRSLNI